MKLITLWEKVPLKPYVYSSVGITLLTVVSIFLLKDSLPPEVPLFYGKPIGSEQLIPTPELFIAPGISLLVITLNSIISIFIDEPFLKRALIISSFFVSILISITVFKIIFLVALW